MRLSPLHKRALYACLALLWLSGSLWLVFHYFLRLAGEFGDTAHPLEVWLLRLHGLMVFAALVALGTIITGHGKPAWRVKRQRRSGLTMAGLSLWLSLTGYALYYFVAARDESWLPLLHWGVGLATPLLLAVHLKRKSHARQRRPLPTTVANMR